MLSQTCLDPILDRLPAEHLVSMSTHCITSLLQVPNTMALMFFTTVWLRALQSAQLIQSLRHKSKSDIRSASSTTLFLAHTRKSLLYSLCATACSLSLVLLLLCCNCAWACTTMQSMCLATTEKYRNGKKSSKAEEGGKYLYLLCCICLWNIVFHLHLIQSSNKSS